MMCGLSEYGGWVE
uniref:Uncharacterized protein n=1 Tax=Rhizophora mucronata TaxID=61149 RepID=A0A2P2PQF8_RHIMU